MATKRRKEDGGTLGRLAGRGEEAVTRLVEELGRNPRVTDALHRAVSAKGRLDSASRSALGTIGLAAADELKDLRKHIERLEKRLAKLEAGGAKRASTRKSTGTKRSTANKKPSPAPGRSIGGGTGRGSPGGTPRR